MSGMDEDTEALARAMLTGWAGDQWDEATDYWHDEFRARAKVVLASDWLAAHDARVRAEALAPIEALADAAEEWSARCMRDYGTPGAAVVRADRLRAAMEAKG